MISYNNVIKRWKKMMYKKLDKQHEINKLKEYTICAWSGKEQKFLIVTIEDSNGCKHNIHYYFTHSKDYSWFLQKLRKLREKGL